MELKLNLHEMRSLDNAFGMICDLSSHHSSRRKKGIDALSDRGNRIDLNQVRKLLFHLRLKMKTVIQIETDDPK